ncbi:chromosomal replication initiator protein DnaA [Helicobacter sp. 23-1046]
MEINDILNQLKNEISEYEFDTFLGKLEFVKSASKEDLLVFLAPNVYIADWVRVHYVEQLKLYAQKLRGIEPEIQIKIKQISSNVKTLDTKKNENLDEPPLEPFNYDQTFDNFVIGKSNEYAFRISQTVAQNQASYPIVLIYGNTGVGKTHLLNAIRNHTAQKGKNVIYITSEKFLNDFMRRIKSQKAMESFRDTYRKCDYLLIDDVQFFGGKEASSEEFFHTFNELYENKKQIVMTSDQPPNKIRGLDERLKSRFEQSIMTEIENTELDTKIEIIKSKCALYDFELDSENISYIATKISNTRQIMGIIQGINFQSNLNPDSNKLSITKSVIKAYLKESMENISVDKIISIVAKELNIKPSEITSKEKSRKISQARRIVIYIANALTLNSYAQLASSLNMKDHTSISKALQGIKETMKKDESLKNLIEEIQNKVKNYNISEV